MLEQYFISEETLSAAIFVALVLVGTFTGMCILRAHDNLALEKKAIDALKDKMHNLMETVNRGLLKDENGEAVQDAYTATGLHAKKYGVEALNSSSAVQRYLYAQLASRSEEEQKEDAKNQLYSGYASDRLYALLCSVSTDNLVRKTPPLADLTELTMQRERGSKATAIFRIMAPTILVLGILGTLFGVHQRLDDWGQEPSTYVGQDVAPDTRETTDAEIGGVESLAGALVPGALAVLITVALMFLRGIYYNRQLAHFCSEFDTYTLEKLLPFFRPLSQTAEDGKRLEHSMKIAASSVARLVELCNELRAYCNRMTSYEASNTDKLLPLSGSLLQHMHQANCECREILQKNADMQQSMAMRTGGTIVAQKNLRSRQEDRNKGLLDSRESLARTYREIGERVLNESSALEDATDICRDLFDYEAELKQSRTNYYNMPSLPKALEQLEAIHHRMLSIANNFEKYKNTATYINETDKKIDATVVQMQQINNALPNLYELQKSCYSKLLAESDIIKQHLLDTLSQHIIPKFREFKIKLHNYRNKRESKHADSVSTFKLFLLVLMGRGMPYYPGGIKGFKLYLKEFTLKARRNKRTRIWMITAFVVSILWSIIIIIL